MFLVCWSALAIVGFLKNLHIFENELKTVHLAKILNRFFYNYCAFITVSMSKFSTQYYKDIFRKLTLTKPTLTNILNKAKGDVIMMHDKK